MFNPDARWDRHLPGDDGLPGEVVDVVALFRKGQLVPRGFAWNGENHAVRQVQFSWQERKGREVFQLFSITDDQARTYTLCVSRRSLVWKIISEES